MFKLKMENEILKADLTAKNGQEEVKIRSVVTPIESEPTITSLPRYEGNAIPTQSNSSSSSYKSKRDEFANNIKQALNAPGVPEMCTDAYFNSKGELIIEVNGEWLVLEEELRKDMVYALTELLRKTKKDLNVEGYGQFFSDSGRGLETFYAD